MATRRCICCNSLATHTGHDDRGREIRLCADCPDHQQIIDQCAAIRATWPTTGYRRRKELIVPTDLDDD